MEDCVCEEDGEGGVVFLWGDDGGGVWEGEGGEGEGEVVFGLWVGEGEGDCEEVEEEFGWCYGEWWWW